MKAILFCNYELALINEKIKPKLDKFGVEILRVVNIDRSGPVDVSRADAVIFMVDLMSEGQRKKIKNIARNGNKRLISLQLQGTDWGRAFAYLAQEATQQAVGAVSSPAWVSPPSHLRAVPPAPISEEEVVEEAAPVSLPEDRALIDEFGAENQKLEEDIRGLRETVQALEERLVDTLSDASDMEILQKKTEMDLLGVRDGKDAAEAKLKEWQQHVAVAQKEAEATLAVRQELETLKQQNKNQEEELLRLRLNKPLGPPSIMPLKKTQDFLAVRDALKSLWAAGAMDKDEVLEKIMNWKPKDL